MSIIYTVICRTTPQLTNLCSYDTAHGNYPTICQQILSQVPITESKIFNYNDEYFYLQLSYNFHILKDDNLLFVCMAASSLKPKTAFAYLQEIKRKFREKYSAHEIQSANDYDMSASFSDVFKETINYFNSNQPKDKKDVLMKELNQLQEVMSENIDKVLQNQQRIELVVKKTTKLKSIADQIKQSTSKMKKQAFWGRNRNKIIGFLIVIIAIIVVYFVFFNKGKENPPNTP